MSVQMIGMCSPEIGEALQNTGNPQFFSSDDSPPDQKFLWHTVGCCNYKTEVPMTRLEFKDWLQKREDEDKRLAREHKASVKQFWKSLEGKTIKKIGQNNYDLVIKFEDGSKIRYFNSDSEWYAALKNKDGTCVDVEDNMCRDQNEEDSW